MVLLQFVKWKMNIFNCTNGFVKDKDREIHGRWIYRRIRPVYTSKKMSQVCCHTFNKCFRSISVVEKSIRNYWVYVIFLVINSWVHLQFWYSEEGRSSSRYLFWHQANFKRQNRKVFFEAFHQKYREIIFQLLGNYLFSIDFFRWCLLLPLTYY